jgi:hypothetical protein
MEILRNGVALGAGGWGTELPIDPGKVEIVTRAPGHLAKTKTITIVKRQHLSTTVEKLELAPVIETVAAGDQGWSGKRKTGAVLFVAGLAGVGVGTYFGLHALKLQDQADANCTFLAAPRQVPTTRKARISPHGAPISLSASGPSR